MLEDDEESEPLKMRKPEKRKLVGILNELLEADNHSSQSFDLNQLVYGNQKKSVEEEKVPAEGSNGSEPILTR